MEAARDVLERARRRRRRAAGAGPGPEEDSERLSAAFASIVKHLSEVSKECEKYYGGTAVLRCKEHEVRHFCKYHGRQEAEREMEFTEEERTEESTAPNRAQTCQQSPRRASKDFYIDVSPGTYSVTAVSEGMVKQTHVVDVRAGQSIDLTFAL